MIAARPTTPESGSPPAIDFATIIEVRLDAEVLHREHPPGTTEAGLHLVRDQHDPVVVADAPQALDELRWRGQEAALALLRLEDDRGDVLGRDVRREHPLEGGERGRGVRPAIRVRVRRPVDLGRERPETSLVRMVFEVIVSAIHVRPWNAPSKAMTACRFVYSRASLTAFSTASAPALKKAARLAADRRERAEPLRELDVALVRNDREVGVEEALDLLGDRLDDARMVVADVRDADSADEVDEGVAVDVRDRRAARARRRSARGRSADARRRSARARGSRGSAGPGSRCGSRSRGWPPRAGA